MDEKIIISKEECHNIVAKKINNNTTFNVLDFVCNNLVESNGFMGIHSQLNVEIEKEDGSRQNHKFFVKSLPKVQTQLEMLKSFNGDLRERHFFNKFCKELKNHSINLLDDVVPACYLTTEESIFFEDLTALGYKMLPSREYLTVDVAKFALKSIAKLHASGLILEEIESCSLIKDFGDDLKPAFFLDTPFQNRVAHSLKRGGDAIIDLTHSPEMKISKETFKAKMHEGFNTARPIPSTKFRNTICHNDLWSKNLMFQFEDDKVTNCMLVDLQTYTYIPPAFDVMFLLLVILDRKTREEKLEELLRFYYKFLNLNLKLHSFKDLISWKEFVESCRYYTEPALIQRMCNYQVGLIRQDVVNEIMSDPFYVNDAMDEKYTFTIEVCKKDPIFEKMHVEAIEELRGFYENTHTGFLYSNLV